MTIVLNELVKHAHTFSSLVDIPDFVKKAYVEDDLSHLDDSIFADYGSRRLPCHTKSATYLSALSLFGEVYEAGGTFTEKQASTRDRVMGFVRYWNLEDDVANMLEDFTKHAAFNPEELEKDFAFDFTYGDEHVQLYPMPNAISVKMAADGLIAHRENFPYSVRKEAAQKILKKAEEFKAPINAELMATLEKTAGNWEMDIPHLLNCLERRMKFAAAQKIRRPLIGGADYEKQASVVELEDIVIDLKNGKTVESVKIAEAIEKFDIDTNLYMQYARGLSMPEDIMYRTPEPKVAAAPTVQLQTGRMYKLAEVIDAGLEPLRVLGDDFITAVTDNGIMDIPKIAQVLPTLPHEPDALLLEKALAFVGVKPC